MGKRTMDQKGFTLIELLLVVVVMGLMLAVIVPRGQRATVDTKYTLVRQAAAEMGSFGLEWAEQGLNTQGDNESKTMDRYLVSLSTEGPATQTWATGQKAFTGDATTNWPGPNQTIGANDSTPLNGVQQVVAQGSAPRNPFNGASYFSSANGPNGTSPVVGALQLATVADGAMHYYAFVFYGTDSTSSTDFYAGQGAGTSLEQLRNGIFMTRVR